jgi:predicted RNA-binding Zn ribbon-like protein
MNTIRADRTGMHDVLDDDWLQANAPGSSLDDVRELRDALRRLAAEATSDDRTDAPSTQDLAQAVETLNRACADSPTWSQLTWPSTRTTHGSELSKIAEEAVDLFSGRDRDRLRPCGGPGCVLYFVRTHPRQEWCSAGCGNRARVARHYRRHHAEPADAQTR